MNEQVERDEGLADPVRRRRERLLTLRRELGIGLPLPGEDPSRDDALTYTLEAAREEDLGGPMIGVKLVALGQFGNAQIQILMALHVAERLALPWIILPPKEGFVPLGADLVQGRLTFRSSDAPLPEGGVVLTGLFFDWDDFAPALPKPDQVALSRTAREVIRPLATPAIKRETRPADEATIHLRSGDVFSTWVHPLYVQPPLAFYALVLRHLRETRGVERARLVFQDRLNPCIGALEDHLARSGIAYRTQSGTLAQDVSALVDARHLLFGIGTFGPAVCRLSGAIETVHFFSPGLGSELPDIPNIEHVFECVDAAGAYMKAGAWQNTAAQRALMLSYPMEHLALVRTGGSGPAERG